MKTCFLIFNYQKFAKFINFLISNIAINFYVIYMYVLIFGSLGTRHLR